MTEQSAWKNKAHTVFRPSHTPRWFASTPPIRESNCSDSRRPTFSDFVCWIGADAVRMIPKSSNAAKNTEQISYQPFPSLPQCFRWPTVGPMCFRLWVHHGNPRCKQGRETWWQHWVFSLSGLLCSTAAGGLCTEWSGSQPVQPQPYSTSTQVCEYDIIIKSTYSLYNNKFQMFSFFGIGTLMFIFVLLCDHILYQSSVRDDVCLAQSTYLCFDSYLCLFHFRRTPAVHL